jgi:hypothetical protein
VLVRGATQEERTTQTASDGAPPRSWVGTLVEWSRQYPYAPLWLALALALVVRVALVIRTGSVIDGDEALIGIQAERILHGQFPVYFYGQSYMGSLETYFIAVVIALTGSSAWALRIVPIILSLALVYLTWRLARALLPVDGAGWLGRGAPLLAGLAALVAAIPPLYDAVTELRAWGGQIEIYVITLALLLTTVELAGRLRADMGRWELTRRWAILGFLAGLGFWVNPLMAYALVACGLWLAFALWRRLTAVRRIDWRVTLQAGLAGLGGVMIGGLPAWIYAIQTGGVNISVYLVQPAPALTGLPVAAQTRTGLAWAITRQYLTCAGPRVLDGALPGEAVSWAGWRAALLAPPLLGLALALGLLIARARRAALAKETPRLGLPLLYVLSVSLIICLGTSAWPMLLGCNLDLAGRYVVPLALVEPFLLLALFGADPLLRALRSTWSARVAAWIGTGALVLLLAGGALQAASYSQASPRAFQSPYYPFGMTDSQQLLDYLSVQHIQAAWCNHWIGNIVTYETDGRTVCADYYNQVAMDGIPRPPFSIGQVKAAANPSFILNLTEPDPLLARELRAQGVPYTIAILHQAGVTVITPARRVNPATLLPGLAEDYGTNLHSKQQ